MGKDIPSGHRISKGYTTNPGTGPQFVTVTNSCLPLPQYSTNMYWYPYPQHMLPGHMGWPPAPSPWMRSSPFPQHPMDPFQPTSQPAGGPPAPPKPAPPAGAKLPGGLMPGATVLYPKSWTYVHVFAKNITMNDLASGRPIKMYIYKLPSKTTVKEFIEMLGGDDNCQMCEVFELGGGQWIAAKAIAHKDERAKKDLEALGWGAERGGKGSKPVYVVWGKVSA